MNGLNDGLDTEDDKVPGDFIQPDPALVEPGKHQPPAEPKTLVTTYGDQGPPTDPKDVPTVKELFGDNVVPNELPNLNANIVLIDQGNNAIADTTEVLGGISKACAVCKEDIQVIDALHPGYINEQRPIQYYTERPSRTMFAETVTALNQKLSSLKLGQKCLIRETVATFGPAILGLRAYTDDRKTDMLARHAEHSLKEIKKYHDENTSNNAKHMFYMKMTSLVVPSETTTAAIASQATEILDTVRGNRGLGMLINSTYLDDFDGPGLQWLASYMGTNVVAEDQDSEIHEFNLVEVLTFLMSTRRYDLVQVIRKYIADFESALVQLELDNLEDTAGFEKAKLVLEQQSTNITRLFKFLSATKRFEKGCVDLVSEIFMAINAENSIQPPVSANS